MNRSEIESSALIEARQALRGASRKAVVYLQDVCISQDTSRLEGHRFDTCFVGNLSKGAGHSYDGKTQNEVISEVIDYGATIGVTLSANPKIQTPLEKYCMNMTPDKFGALGGLCRDAIAMKDSPLHVLELQPA